MIRTFRSHAALARAVDAERGISLLTVDVFDTLLLRRTTPGLIRDIVAVSWGRELGGRSPGEVLDARAEAERVTEATRVSLGLDCEVHFRDMLRRMARALTREEPTDALIERLAEIETRTEAEMLRPNLELVEAIRRNKAAGARVVAVSDMYLSGDDIRGLLRVHGCEDAVDDVVVSSDAGITKRSGRLFARMAEEAPSKGWVHVGDDAATDGNGAAHGARTFLCNPSARRAHRVRMGALEEALRTSPEGLVEAASALDADEGDLKGFALDAGYRVGRDRLGPVVAAFVHALALHARDSRWDRAWFMAREGYALKKAYDVFALSNPGLCPPSGYLLVSRAALMPAASPRYGAKEYLSTVWNAGTPTLRNLLAPAGVDEGTLSDIAFEYGIASVDERLDPTRDHGLLLAVEDERVQTACAAAHADRKSCLESYLRGAGFLSGGTAGVVDVGWSGQIQGYLEAALRDVPGAPLIEGAYVATTPVAETRRGAGSSMKGFLWEGDASDWVGRSISLFVQILEDGLRAPHGGTKGYIAGRPVLADENSPSRVAEAFSDGPTALIQAGILDYMRSYSALSPLAHPGSAAESVRLARLELARLVRFPTPAEARVFLDLTHVLNFTGDEIVTHALQQPSPFRSPLGFMRALSRARWKEAVAGRAFGLTGQMALVVRRALAERGGTGRRATRHVAREVPAFTPGPIPEEPVEVSSDLRHAALLAKTPIHRVPDSWKRRAPMEPLRMASQIYAAFGAQKHPVRRPRIDHGPRLSRMKTSLILDPRSHRLRRLVAGLRRALG